ncbi:MAG TPA: IS1634 family transposase [bacterium]|nr:IS1634 family transposase [bacterium]HQI47444.1 IS1634 family transposase [bacterium]HQJ64665.1 IS1634 family transposase [bacterium]
MYIRQITRKNKDGSKVTYVQLAHNERDPEKGCAVAKILYNFGRIDELDVDQLKRLTRSISRFLSPEDALETKAALELGANNLKFKSCRSYGGIYLLAALWQQLQLEKILEKELKQSKYQIPVSKAVFAMVANRCLAPSSKLAITEWIERDVHIPGLEAVDVQVLYRAMDYLLERQEELEKEIFWSVSTLLNLEVDLLFFDTTSTYFETESQTDLKKRGYSKDKRADLPQVVIGLAVNRDGIPVKHWVFPGNTADMSTIEQVKKDLVGWQLGRCIFVHDAGMTSEDNLQYLQRAGGHYIVGRKLKSGEPAAEAALAHKGPYTAIKENLSAREVSLGGDGEKRKRLVLVRNSEEEKKQLLVRQQIVAAIERKLEEINSRKGQAHTKATCALKSHAVYGKYVKELQDGRLKLDKGKVADESRYDGKFLIETSDDTLSLEDIVLGYKQLNDVEQAFRTLKTTLELRPNYHSKDERIRCHIFLCFLALVLARIAELKTGVSWSSVRQEMSRLQMGQFTVDQKTVSQLTELTQQQKFILKQLAIKEPVAILDIQ